MKSNNPDILNAIIEGLEKGNGRVASCKKAGITFETFCDWMNTDSPRFNSDFSERVKKAEGHGRIRIKEICENVILKSATDSEKPVWQAAAWLLERRFKDEYAANANFNVKTNKQELDIKVQVFKIGDQEIEL